MPSETLRLRHPQPLNFDLPRLGIRCSVALPTRGQIRELIALDPEADAPAEKPADLDARRALALEILCAGSDVPLDQLHADEEVQLFHALMAAHHGYDPMDAVAMQRYLQEQRDLALKKKAEELAQTVSKLTTETASNSPTI